jgi:hypothetical protein
MARKPTSASPLIDWYRYYRSNIQRREREISKRGYRIDETLVPRIIKRDELSDIELQAEINRISQIKPIDIYSRATYVTPEAEVISGAEQQHRQHIIGYYKGIGKEQLEKRPEQVPQYVENYFKRKYKIQHEIEYENETWIAEADRQYQQEQDDRYRIYRDYREKYPMEIADKLTDLELAKSKTENETVKNAIQHGIDRIKSDYEQRTQQEEFDAISIAEQKDALLRKYYQALDDNDKKAADYYKESFERISGETVEEQDLTKYSWYQAPETAEEKVDEESEWQDVDYNYRGEDYGDESDRQYVDYNYHGNDYRVGEDFAPGDLKGSMAFLNEIEERIRDGFYNTRGGLRFSHHKHGWRPYDFDEDKNALLTMWRNTVDRYTNNKADMIDFVNYIKENNAKISELIEAIKLDSDGNVYRAHYAELFNILHYDAPTVEELMNFGDIEEV